MAVTEVFADGLSGVRIVGDTVRLDFVSLSGGEGASFDPRVRVVLPTTSLPALLALLTKAQRTAQQNRQQRMRPAG